MTKFKVGDWVRHKNLNSVHICTSINGGEFNNKISTKPSLSFNSEFMSEYELWQPQEDEWCWCVWMQTYTIQKRELIKWNNRMTRDSFNIVEPFIGELPSFLKETK